ncbi:MAG: hypothetical protein IJK64_02230 [Clostridia bacterium]|nr:hypothetical protein [Clostridia bacterium]
MSEGGKVRSVLPQSEAMCSATTRKAHIACEATITPAGRITLRAAEHIIEKTPSFDEVFSGWDGWI